MIGAAPRDLHLGAGAGRWAVEAVMMMRVPPQHLLRPAQRRQPGHIGGLRSALDDDVAAVAAAQTGDFAPAPTRRLGEPDQHLLAFSHDHDIDAEFPERRARGR